MRADIRSRPASWLGRHVGQDRTAAPFLVLKIALAEFLAGPAEAGLQPPVEVLAASLTGPYALCH